ncbi:MAG: ABC transporter substrate-binding protein [Bacteroidetes bacterium]|nr:ABC transporter substrate-binding protein [Bacteroidota bacterium]
MKNFHQKKHILCFLYAAIILVFIAIPLNAQQGQRIVSLAPSLTKSIVLLNKSDNLVGRTSFCQFPSRDEVPVVATAVDVNLEKVFSLKPDLVITSSLTHPETIEHLEKLGVTVRSYPYPTSYDNLCEQLIDMGELLGQKELAKKIVARSKNQLDSLQNTIPDVASPEIFMEIGANPLFTAVPNTFMHDYIVYTKGKNVAHDFTKGSISRETVLVRNPDVIFIVTMGVVGEEEKKTWEAYPNLSAARNNQIHIIDADKSCSPTAVTFVEVVDEMIQLMYRNN